MNIAWRELWFGLRYGVSRLPKVGELWVRFDHLDKNNPFSEKKRYTDWVCDIVEIRGAYLKYRCRLNRLLSEDWHSSHEGTTKISDFILDYEPLEK